MRLVVTDTGFVWNQNNPFLEKYKDIVLVVCLGGKAVTDKYKCFVSPFTDDDVVIGTEKYGIEDKKLQKLTSVGEELDAELGYHDDIVFLTDNQPSSLYPFYVVKELNYYNRLHLVAMPPWKFEHRPREKAYRELLSDLSKLNSILYYDSGKVLEKVERCKTIEMLYEYITNELGKMMPCFLNGIYTMHSNPCFFDFAAMKYVPLEDGFDKFKLFKKDMIENHVDSTMGLPLVFSRPVNNKYTKKKFEELSARLDGKKVCNVLREQRIKLAEANHISFKSAECGSIGPCAGTCERCDMESEYLRKQMQNIPEEKRVYPQFNPKEEMEL